MKNDFLVVIPARYGSTRLEGKPLLPIRGKPMVEHVYRRAVDSGAKRVIVATDDRRIAVACEGFGAQAVMTRVDHPSGTDRLAEVAQLLDLDERQVVVNLQGDEPLMPPALIRELAQALLSRGDTEMATVATPIHSANDIFDPNVVKVVRDYAGNALYFSRAPVPWNREQFADPLSVSRVDGYLRHLGIYAYRAGFLMRYPGMAVVDIERHERLEQLRALWHGAKIFVVTTAMNPGPGVDTREDLRRVEQILGTECA